MRNGNGTITTPPQLVRLVTELTQHNPNTRIRFRLMGNMWEADFLQIVHKTDNTLIVQDDKSGQMKFIPIRDVMEFELEQQFQNYYPNHHYKVTFP